MRPYSNQPLVMLPCHACNLLTSQIGGFSQEYGKGYWEDTDLAFKVSSLGMSIVYQPVSVVVHNEGGSLSAEKEALMQHNQQIFISRWKHVLQREHCSPSTPMHSAAMRLTGAFRLLWIDDMVPEPDKDSGSVRALNILRIFQELGFHVDFHATSTAIAPRDKRYESEARFRGIQVTYGGLYPVITTQDGRCIYNLVLVARYMVYNNVKSTMEAACHGVPIIFDTVGEQQASMLSGGVGDGCAGLCVSGWLAGCQAFGLG